MKCARKVKLNFDYINDFLKKRGITKSEFCRRIGYADNWLAAVEGGKKCYSNGINEAKARLMCTVWGMEYDSLVIKEREPVLAVEVDEKKERHRKSVAHAHELHGGHDGKPENHCRLSKEHGCKS